MLRAQELFFRNIGSDQGLPSSETYKLLQDRNGYIWTATDGGVARFDGSTMSSYTSNEGLSENVVLGLYEDRYGRIWFRTLSGDICYYENGRIRAIAANPELRKLVRQSFTTSLFLGEGDTLFCGTGCSAGLLKIPPAGNYSKVIRWMPAENGFVIANKTRPGELVAGLAASTDLNTSFLTLNCLGRTVIIDRSPESRHLDNTCRVMRDRRGNCYWPSFRRLALITPEGKISYTEFGHDIARVYQDHDGDLWVGVKSEGVYCYAGSNLAAKPLHFLDGLTVSDILQDREGAIWLSTIEKGIFQSLNKNVFFIGAENEKVLGFVAAGGQMRIACEPAKELLAGAGGGVAPTETMRLLPPFCSLLHIVPCAGGYAYFTDKGLFHVKDGRVTPILHEGGPLLYSRRAAAAGDSLVFSTYANICVSHRGETVRNQFLPFVVNAIHFSKRYGLLFGSRSSDGLLVLEKDTFRPFLEKFPELRTRINCIAESPDGKLWIGTNEKGLFCYDGETLLAYNERKGLPSSKVNELDFDENGDAWIATNKGLGRIPGGQVHRRAIAYDKGHGLPGVELEKLACFGGKVWCATKEQLFCFETGAMRINQSPPPVVLSAVTVNTLPQSADSFPELEAGQNNVGFTLHGMTYRKWHEKKFAYKLEGYKDEWQISGTGLISYTNLPPGTYAFVAHALNNDNTWSARPAVWRFTIRKPYWKTLWFICCVIAAAAAGVYFLARWWVLRVKRREQEKAKIGKLLSEFQMTALRAQMNPHFIFNAISSIQHYILQNEVQQSYNYLAKFSKLIRNVLDQSKEEELLLSAELETLQLYIELEQLRFSAPFAFELQVDEELEPDNIYIPTMLLQPFIENAIWHGLMPKKEKGTLRLLLRRVPAGLLAVIEDDGIGRAASRAAQQGKLHESKGLSISRRRLDLLNAEQEHRYTLLIEDLYDTQGGAAGTRVTLTIPVIYD